MSRNNVTHCHTLSHITTYSYHKYNCIEWFEATMNESIFETSGWSNLSRVYQPFLSSSYLFPTQTKLFVLSKMRILHRPPRLCLMKSRVGGAPRSTAQNLHNANQLVSAVQNLNYSNS